MRNADAVSESCFGDFGIEMQAERVERGVLRALCAKLSKHERIRSTSCRRSMEIGAVTNSQGTR